MLYSKGTQGNAYFYQNRFTFDDNATTRHIKVPACRPMHSQRGAGATTRLAPRPGL